MNEPSVLRVGQLEAFRRLVALFPGSRLREVVLFTADFSVRSSLRTAFSCAAVIETNGYCIFSPSCTPSSLPVTWYVRMYNGAVACRSRHLQLTVSSNICPSHMYKSTWYVPLSPIGSLKKKSNGRVNQGNLFSHPPHLGLLIFVFSGERVLQHQPPGPGSQRPHPGIRDDQRRFE